ncbi:MAG TPA: dTDP-glucose 4,6-dehydratase [bacterium (Candidatus Stahlbacteria)]|nr:dTDP-glucose 4,6-dehydratase [Candidatus Stahlbacteria bacterium]
MNGDRILITGGAGFIGSNLIRIMIENYQIICLDRISYATNPRSLEDLTNTIFLPRGYPEPKRTGGMRLLPLQILPSDRLIFIAGSVNDPELVSSLLSHVSGVIHLAAWTHVDRSLVDPGPFLENDLMGTYTLLEALRREKGIRLLHVSTDEIYGSLREGVFTEESPINPSSPYAVSKAAADRLVFTYHQAYGLEAMIVRPANNYGPYQHIEKFIPFMITSGLKGLKLYLYGDGRNVRSWIYVEDCARAIRMVYEKGKVGGIYNIPGIIDLENRKVAESVCQILNLSLDRIEYIKDRPLHDFRYAMEGKRIRSLGFIPKVSIEEGLDRTVEWYCNNRDWWQELWDEDFEDYVKEWYGGLGAGSIAES